MKYFDLDKEEKQLLEDFEKGELVSIGKNKIKQYQAYATATFKKTRNINIRLSEKDVLKLKTKAIEAGIPYQTLVSSILHRFVSK
jgi:predicted DNA binding CopG/RHH family protein